MPEQTRLSGPLLVMVIAAALAAGIGVGGMALAFDQLRVLGSRYVVAVGFITGWALVFLIMTMIRARATPMVASVALVAWVGYRLCVALFFRGGWPLVIDLLGEAILAAGFCGYMLTGALPNAYYRQRK